MTQKKTHITLHTPAKHTPATPAPDPEPPPAPPAPPSPPNWQFKLADTISKVKVAIVQLEHQGLTQTDVWNTLQGIVRDHGS
jgi:hypothetical protein